MFVKKVLFKQKYDGQKHGPATSLLIVKTY